MAAKRVRIGDTPVRLTILNAPLGSILAWAYLRPPQIWVSARQLTIQGGVCRALSRSS